MSEHTLARLNGSLGAVFAYPFRIFFLSLGVMAVVTIPLWLLLLFGRIDLPLALPALHWHQHEMLFGFLQAAIAGFLLTAVCVWTQTERTYGAALLRLWLVWLAGRLTLLLGAGWPDILVLAVNLAFMPLVMWDAGRRIWQARQQRQLVILIILGALWLLQAGYLIAPHPVYTAATLVLAMALMLVIGGRITPAFSGNWLRQQGQDPNAVKIRPWLEKATLITTLLLVPALFIELTPLTLTLAVLASLFSLLRLAGWQGWRTRTEPLLWILHLSLLWIPLALGLLAAHLAGWISSSVWQHAAGYGAMGGLILGVISRVALGHTGRPLRLPAGMTLAFILLHVGALVRVATALQWLPWHPGLGISALCWMAAYGLFLWRYTGVLVSPRTDGRPG